MTLKKTTQIINNIGYNIHEEIDIQQTILQWRNLRNQADLEKIQIWSYFKIRKFFIKRCLHDNLFKPSDVDVLIEKAYFRFLKNYDKVRKPENFAAWLKVVCTHSLFEFVKIKKNKFESLTDEINENDYPVNDQIMTDIINQESKCELSAKIQKLMTPAEAVVVIKKIFENSFCRI